MQVNRVKIGLGPVPRGPKATNKRKLCAKQGCLKQARDGSSHCISHGGGRRCEVPSCTKSAAPVSCAKSTAVGSLGGLVGEVSDLKLVVEDGKGSMNIWRVDKAEEEIVLNSLGDGFVLLDIPPQGKTTIYYHPPSGFQSAEGPTRDFEAEFKSVNPFHHLKKKALSYLTPTIHCKKLFGAVMSTPRRNYKKGVEGFLQFLRDTHDERLRKIHAWIP
ncbi:hypothetical protein FOZ62_031189 [Perkinsus olseni]|uniref:Uncharacterized protein n=1 Tax=Perkinsus olseni TaxID=32597 RepID=A0A7J6QLH0_PEROL|nr:hypothetical protein FOZ62_031189 [Perkinsus olseni]